jgi:hypothetical protein
MNSKLLLSKKFRAACLAAVAGLLSFCVTQFGFSLDVDKTMGLVGVLMTPFLIYIGAEGYSEASAKKVIEENKVSKDTDIEE